MIGEYTENIRKNRMPLKKNIKNKIIASMLLLMTLSIYLPPMEVAASSPPRMPLLCWGYISIGTNLQPIPDGYIVGAKINGVVYNTVETNNGTYVLQVPADNLDTPELDGGNEGDIVYLSIVVDNITYQAPDTAIWHQGNSVRQDMTVNRPPTFNSMSDVITINESENLTITPTATDSDGDNLTHYVNELPIGSIFANGTFTWTPDADKAGSYNVTFKVTDGVLVANKTIEINVNDIRGDYSGDGFTDAWDLTYLARFIGGIQGYEVLYSDDVSGDSTVDAWDITYLARAIAWIEGYQI